MNRSYRIKTNIGSDQVLNVNLKQDIDIYEILSLKLGKNKLSPEGLSVNNMYKMYSADYGVIVGRVLANDAFGVPNAKISVFIPLSKEDKASRRDIRAIYPFNFVTDVDKRNVKYNTLPNYKKFECHQAVGSFPNKRLVLDDDSVLELYDKYYKYTTVTNNAGDYMLFGIPTGQQILHMDVDLSDIGVLSQEPRDFIYKGYSPNLFESPTQFKKSTNIDGLPQIQNQSTSVNVYPLWGDKNSAEIAITRKDITLQYKFEPTCVFIGSVVTDNGKNSINHNCIPDEKVGEADQLVPSKGDIEMIRRTIDDEVEEFQIKGNQLIDADGTWCYQIPMNLDYVGTDEYGNIIPTSNPNKGIPTRTRVRFRITLDESGNESQTTHKARYLIPNNPDLDSNSRIPHVRRNILNNDSYYEFGSLTPDECFRDLYWNKVYSVKNYIPRIQRSKYESTTNYLAIKGVNKPTAADNNLMPFNKLNVNLTIPSFSFATLFSSGIFSGDFWKMLRRFTRGFSSDEALEKMLDDSGGLSLDFYNDWLNGCLYFPSWFWHVRRRRDFKKGDSVYESKFCDCRQRPEDSDSFLYLFTNGSLYYSQIPHEITDLVLNRSNNVINTYFKENRTRMPYGSRGFFGGIINRVTNRDGADAFYYSFGNMSLTETPVEGDNVPYVRLFSTDIILLGSLKDNDLDGVPKMQYNMPSTTANIPPLGAYKTPDDTGERGEEEGENFNGHTGMHWGNFMHDNEGYIINKYGYIAGGGLFFRIHNTNSKIWLVTEYKTPINAERICELGVTLDSDFVIPYEYVNGLEDDNVITGTSYYHNRVDGLITKREIEDVKSRSLFATLNYNKLNGTIENYNTGYKKYNLVNLYQSDFDGRLEEIAQEWTTVGENPPITYDYRCRDYLDFRFGNNALEEENEQDTISYRSLSVLYNGRKKWISGIDFDTTPVQGRNGITYVLGDGAVQVQRPIRKTTRHFYGVNWDNIYERVYPLDSITPETRRISNFFPLYDNSFYFYFGLKQGSTAIDKFYEQFYSDCANRNDGLAEIEIIAIPSMASQINTNGIETGGTIILRTEETALPYSVDIRIKGAENPLAKHDVNSTEYQVDGLENNKYVLTITDTNGNVLEREAELKYEKVRADIGTETSEDEGVLGIIRFNSHILYTKTIDNKEKYVKEKITSIDGENGNYKVKTEKDGTYKLKIVITPSEGDINDYITGKSGNAVNIRKSGKFTIEVCELNDGKDTNNSSYYTISI